jgi:cytidyltransferase-like protein
VKTVLMFGTFDILHPGHLRILKQARLLGDKLVVVIALDSTVNAIKKRSPVHNQEERQKQIQAVSSVSRAILGYEDDKYKVLDEVRPDIIALGYDQEAFVDMLKPELKKRGLKTKIVRLKSYRPEIYKSSKLREKFAL